MRVLLIISALIVLLANWSCEFVNSSSSEVAVPVASVVAEQDEHAEDEEVHLTPAQLEVMDIQLGKFQHLNLATSVKANGRLELPPQRQASFSAVREGRVKSIKVLEGDYVRRGQILAELEHPEFIELQQEYMVAKTELEFHKNELEREKQLFEEGIISSKEYQQVRTEYHATVPIVNALAAELEMLEIDVASAEEGNFVTAIPVRAPISGFVQEILVNMGMYVHPGDRLFEIADNHHIHIDLKVFERDIDKIKKGQKVNFTLTTNPDSIYQASIFAIGKSFDMETKAMVVHAEIENELGSLLPGMYVDARIITNAEEVLALPDEAIVREGGLDYIFALQPASAHVHVDGTEHLDHDEEELIFSRIQVSTGARDMGFTEVVPEIQST